MMTMKFVVFREEKVNHCKNNSNSNIAIYN